MKDSRNSVVMIENERRGLRIDENERAFKCIEEVVRDTLNSRCTIDF